MGLREFTFRRVLWKNIKNTAEKFNASFHLFYLYWLNQTNSIHIINRHILFYEAKTHRINEYIPGYKCTYCINGNPHFYTYYTSWKKMRLLFEKQCTELLNSILLCLQFPKHWRNIHIYSITSTHNTSMVAPSLKLNTTRVTRVIDEHLEFPHLHIWYEGPSLFMKTRNNLWVSQMLGRKEINLLCSRQIDSVLLLCRWNAPHIQRTSIYYFSCVYIHDCASLLKLCKKSPYFLRTISFIKQSIIRIQFQVFNNTGM